MAVAPLIGLGLNLLSSVPQWLSGRDQEARADELAANNRRPTFAVPESQNRALASAEYQAGMTRLPGQSGIEGRLDQTTANKVAMLERLSPGGATTINSASRAYGQQMDAENDLGERASNMWLRNQDVLGNELDDQADYEMKAWDWNERQPYQDRSAAIEALREGGMRNKNAAWKNVFGAGSAFFGNLMGGNADMSWLDTLMNNNPVGGGGQPITTDPNQMPRGPVSGGSNPMIGQQTLPGNQRMPMWNSFDYGGIRK